MSLQRILEQVYPDAGFDPVAQRDYVIQKINRFARNLHDTQELQWSDREQTFILDYTKNVAALPWNVATFRGGRDVDYNSMVSTVGVGPRFRRGTWRSIISQYRVLMRSPIKKDLLSGTKVWIHLPKASAGDIQLNLVGKSTTATRMQEAIVIPAGSLLAVSESVFEGFENIEKLSLSDVDLVVSISDDPDDVDSVIGEVPNHQHKSQYLLVQHSDLFVQRSQDILLEAWYKHAFVPVRNDFDNFIFTDVYDNAIIQGTTGLLKTESTKPEEVTVGMGMLSGAVSLALEISKTEHLSMDEEISQPGDPILEAHEVPSAYMLRRECFPCR